MALVWRQRQISAGKCPPKAIDDAVWPHRPPCRHGRFHDLTTRGRKPVDERPWDAYLAPLAGWRRSSAVEQGNHNPLVGGSNPSAATIWSLPRAVMLVMPGEYPAGKPVGRWGRSRSRLFTQS